MNPEEVRPPTDLGRLTTLRAFAALAVFAFHLRSHTDWLWHERYARYGFAGVGFFFVLSGFVLTWSFREGATVRDFYVRRFARIYPSHLVTALVALVVPVTVWAVTPWGVAANITLMQAWFPRSDIAFSLNGVSWSLACEAFFYAGAPFVIPVLLTARTRTVVAVGVGWSVATAASALLLAHLTSGSWTYVNPVLRSGEFVLGVSLAALLARGWSPRLPFAAAVTLVAVAVLALSSATRTLTPTVAGVLLTPALALVVVCAGAADRDRVRSFLHGRGLVYLGEISFGFYLVHELVIINLYDVLGTATSVLAGAGAAATALGLSLGCAVLLHELVERPGQRRIAAIRRRRA